MLRLLALAVCLVAAACATTPPGGAAPERAITLIVSIDGFRADYLDRGLTPTIAAIGGEGVRVGALVPSFPTITFPSHYTLVTGLHPDRHGIVGNRMLDPAIVGEFRLSDRAQVMDRRWWDDAEPIWVTAEKAGVRTATMFWPGTEANIQGVRPGEWIPFQQSIGSDARVDIVLGWLTMPPAERPQFLTLYFDIVDTAGHNAGPRSPEVDKALADVDAAVKRLREGLAARGLTDRVNLIVTADHGMTEVVPGQAIVLDEMTDMARATVIDGEAMVGLYPADGYGPALEAALLKPHAHMGCWRKAEIPARFAYGRHRRVPPYVCVAELGWIVTTRERIERQRTSGRSYKGLHGYDPERPEMQAIFVARGPAFRAGATIARARSVDVYPLLTRLVGVTPRPNDGDPAAFASALAAP